VIWPLAFIVPEGLNVTLLTPLANQNAPRVPPEVVNDKLLVPESLPIPVTVATGAKENDIVPERSSSPAVVAESEKVIVDVPDKKLKPETVLDVVKAIEEAPTVTELSSSNMPGVYSLLLDEDMTIDSGDHSQELVLHITQASMAPVTRVIELYRPDVTAGTTLGISSGNAQIST